LFEEFFEESVEFENKLGTTLECAGGRIGNMMFGLEFFPQKD